MQGRGGDPSPRRRGPSCSLGAILCRLRQGRTGDVPHHVRHGRRAQGRPGDDRVGQCGAGLGGGCGGRPYGCAARPPRGGGLGLCALVLRAWALRSSRWTTRWTRKSRPSRRRRCCAWWARRCRTCPDRHRATGALCRCRARAIGRYGLDGQSPPPPAQRSGRPRHRGDPDRRPLRAPAGGGGDRSGLLGLGDVPPSPRHGAGGLCGQHAGAGGPRGAGDVPDGQRRGLARDDDRLPGTGAGSRSGW